MVVVGDDDSVGVEEVAGQPIPRPKRPLQVEVVGELVVVGLVVCVSEEVVVVVE